MTQGHEGGGVLDRHQTIKQWYIDYSQDVYNFLVYYTGRKDVEDHVQDVFIKAINGFNKYKGDSHPKTWLFTIARRVVIDSERKKKWTKWLPFEKIAYQLKSTLKTPDELLHMKEDADEVYHSLNKLRKNYRDVLLLRIINELSVEDTAKIMQWTPQKVRLTTYRALNALRRVHSLNLNEEEEGGLLSEKEKLREWNG